MKTIKKGSVGTVNAWDYFPVLGRHATGAFIGDTPAKAVNAAPGVYRVTVTKTSGRSADGIMDDGRKISFAKCLFTHLKGTI